MDESRKAFDIWWSSDAAIGYPWQTWQAAVEWARKDERERLARLAERRIDSHGFDAITSEEIRIGKLK